MMIIRDQIDVDNRSHLPESGDFVGVDPIKLQVSEAFSSHVVPTLEDKDFVKVRNPISAIYTVQILHLTAMTSQIIPVIFT
mgnify:CR=1 FL=1